MNLWGNLPRDLQNWLVAMLYVFCIWWLMLP